MLVMQPDEMPISCERLVKTFRPEPDRERRQLGERHPARVGRLD
jgi:hypothetical protein